MEEKDHVDKGFDRVRLFLGGCFIAHFLLAFIFEPFHHVLNTPVEFITMAYIGFVLMATFWDDV